MPKIKSEHGVTRTISKAKLKEENVFLLHHYINSSYFTKSGDERKGGYEKTWSWSRILQCAFLLFCILIKKLIFLT